MARSTRNTAILAKIETTQGTDAVPTGAANALLISDASFDISYNNVDRSLIRGFFGGAEQLAGTRFVDMSFSVEISGSGTAGTAPAWGPLLQACGYAEAVTASTRVDYTPISTGQKSLTIYYSDDGVLHKALGCMGNVEFAMGAGERPLLKFNFAGIDGARFKRPVEPGDQLIMDVTLDRMKAGIFKFTGTTRVGDANDWAIKCFICIACALDEGFAQE